MRPIIFQTLGPVLLAAVIGLALPGTVRGQSSEVADLLHEVGRLRRDLDILQRHVYAGAAPPARPEAAMAPPPEDAQRLARVHDRLTAFETELRNLTGRVEEIGFKLGRSERRLDKLVEDIDFRLTAIERRLQEGPAPADRMADQQTSPPPAAEPATGSAALAPAPVASDDVAPAGSNVLGTVSQRDIQQIGTTKGAASGSAETAMARAPAVPSILPGNDPEAQYKFAWNLLRKHDWIRAEQAFLEYLERYPDNRYSPNAHYWLGETYYVRRLYPEAAQSFLTGYRSFPESDKAPDSLYKLGKALDQLGDTEEACAAFAQVIERYEPAQSDAVRFAQRERKRLGCS